MHDSRELWSTTGPDGRPIHMTVTLMDRDEARISVAAGSKNFFSIEGAFFEGTFEHSKRSSNEWQLVKALLGPDFESVSKSWNDALEKIAARQSKR